ncbi:D-alanyl-D-alanine carboxypeptidase [hydrothermal vent metagenome]|uniref:D-alanyl-D-alanine carboxypeptidase n=1 Tax=hydrothermal vent metagenome TaxID=652676 RepID=A0A3B1C4M7_9ZZZZ
MRFCFFIVFTLFLVLPQNASAGKLSADIDKALTEPCLNPEQTAVRIVEIKSGKVVYDKNGDEAMTPASIMKVLTTATSLSVLGPNYRFKTDFLVTGKITGGVVNGDLVIRGGGDPDLTPEEVWKISEELARMGIKEITGNLVLDNTFFDDMSKAPSWNGTRTQNPYDAKLSALSVNFNTVAVHVYPGITAGEPLRVSLEPGSGYFTIANKSKTIARGKRKILVKRVKRNGGYVMVVNGTMRRSDHETVIYVNINEPLIFAGKVFKFQFAKSGIKILGNIKKGKATDKLKVLVTHKSKPLSVILRGLNRYSNNFVAEQIIKTMDAEMHGKPGTHKTGLEITRQFLSNAKVNLANVTLADGSGLSRKNRLTAHTLTDLLVAVNHNFKIWPDFVSALGIMGVDGSVRNRLAGSQATGMARAKTGTLSRISTLTGYVATKKTGKLYGYAIFLNNMSCYYKQADKIEDKIVTAIHMNGDTE